MQLVKHHTIEGYRVAVIVKTGAVWMQLAYVGDTRLRRVHNTEQRHMAELREARPVDIKRINAAARRNGRGTRSKLI